MAVKTVNCPGCQQLVEWSEASPHRPFCSLRCKQQDFCDWANERHVIADESEAEDEEWSEGSQGY
jgi:uncharacterized protein